MASKFDIVNGALVRLGANEISTFTDDTAESAAARRLYDNTLNDLLSRYPWRFMMNQLELARLTEKPKDRWDSAYALPTDCDVIKAVNVNGHPVQFDRYGDKIFTNASVGEHVVLDYVRKVKEEYFPGYFCTLLEFELAAGMAIPIGDRADLAEAYEKRALRHFSLAKNVDSQGRTARRMPLGRFHRVRWGTSYGA